MPTRFRPQDDEGFTLIEVIIGTVVLVVVMAATAPMFFGAMRLTGVTDHRSQATNLAVLATEQMRSLPYSEVGYQTTPASCANPASLNVTGLGAGAAPVVLTSAGPLDSMPTTTVEQNTTFTLLRCVYWAASSIPGSSNAYKQTVVQVSWTSPGGTILSVTQSSALYPGTQTPPTTTTQTTIPQTVAPVCSAADDPTSPTTAVDVTWTAPVGGSPPDHFVLDYTTYNPGSSITGSGMPYSASPDVSGLSWVAPVGPGATYWFQVAAVAADGSAGTPSAPCSASTTAAAGTTTHDSAASATAISLALGGSTTPYTVTAPATTATNDGTQSDSPQVAQPTVSIPGADSFLSVTGATQIAEAAAAGSSYACAGLLSSGATMSGGSTSGPCSVSGGGSGGVVLNLASLPGVGSAINTLVGGLTLNLSGATAWATESAATGSGGATASGSASLTGATITVSTVGGLVTQTLSLSLPATLTSQTDVVQAITVAIGASANPTIAALAAPLQAALAPVLSLTGEYQSSSGGVLTVSALHISVLSGVGQADLALTTVGANTAATTQPACTVSSLVVTPSTGANGGGVALTTDGHLVSQTSFDVAVSANSTCTNLEVGYAPTDCVPGASGCQTLYATLAGQGGTYYGTAGTSSTVWNVGTTTFTVFVGSPATPYSPLAQQQVILCTEKGTSGQC